MSKPRLSYFGGRGLAEPIRLLLKDAKVEYEEVNLGTAANGVFPEAFLALKASGVLDYGSVPYWEENGLNLVQSFAISRHLARKHGYNGENEAEAAKIDSVVEGTRDLVMAIRKVLTVPAEQKAQTWQEISKVDIPKWFGFFEALLKKSGTGFFVGKKASLADIYVIAYTEEIRCLDKSALASFPLLSAHLDAMFARPNLAAYAADPNRYPPQFARFIGQ
eukprot:Phypoly_transcript_16992.p1 GENE.Phypoly_transcript_16992~~Phypoly_transcript_16992.p1  ORF type:complete len:220 (+),score=44.72 Phypoly_transcript_16992:151-810(+)